MSESTNDTAWGRVDDSGAVFVREGESWRAVGEFPDASAEEALAYFERKFTDLAGQVSLLEQRIARGTAPGDVAQTVERLRGQLEEPAAVGDLAALRSRVDKLSGRAEELTEQQQLERAAARREAVEAREAIVSEAERLAAQPEASIRWRESGEAFERLFSEWQAIQRSGSSSSKSLSKSQSAAMWKRFRAARQSFDSARRSHFAQVEANNKQVKQRKERIIAAAEALAPSGVDAIPEYRSLLDAWKEAGRASRKLDDQLWARFKAAGDVLYQAKATEVAQSNEEFSANLAAKDALLGEFEGLLEEPDHARARARLTELQLRWDEIGRVPREAIRPLEGRLRALEDHVKRREDEHWRRTNPETKARSEGLRGQLETSIDELTEQIARARERGDTAAVETATKTLETQRSWLAALGD